jgi:hypothetical protein
VSDDASYDTAVRTFDHELLVRGDSYQALRKALNDVARESPDGFGLKDFLAAVRDMAVTQPYGDQH